MQPALGLPSPPTSSPSILLRTRQGQQHVLPSRGDSVETPGLACRSLIDRARALCAAADDVQRATIEASRRIAAIHGSPDRLPKKKQTPARVKEPPDVCARLPSDVPPPRGEGWRRLGPVSVVRGSNRISAPPQTNRRALTREVEVCIDGDFYSVVPADIDPGGGFCVSLDRDFTGETNMACMLYIRKKMRKKKIRVATMMKAPATGQTNTSVVVTATDEIGKNGAPQVAALIPSKEEHSCILSPPQHSKIAAPAPAAAPFGSVGETPKPTATATAAATATVPVRPRSPSPFSACRERELDVYVTSRPEEKSSGSTAIVLEAQRRARRRAFSAQKRKAAAEGQKEDESAKKVPAHADMERLKASRRAALARVASQKKKEETQKHEAEAKAGKERQEREAEAAERADALRSAAAARGSIVAAEKRQRERQLELAQHAEAEAKRERVAAVLAYDETQADEREKRVRNETCVRIRREERRRELARRRQEDERVEMMRLYECGERSSGAGTVISKKPASVPAVHSARSFFSITDSASVPETAGAPPRTGQRKTWGSVEDTDHKGDTGDTHTGRRTNEGSAQAAHQNAGLQTVRSNQQQQQPKIEQQGATPPPHRTTTVAVPISGAFIDSDTTTPPTRSGPELLSPQADGDDSGKVVIKGRCKNPSLLLLTRTTLSRQVESASASATPRARSGGSGRGSTFGGGRQVILERRRVATTPVWKRPAVPLSRPYVPVPRKDNGRIS